MSRVDDLAREGVVHEVCGLGDELTECGQCLGVWCDRCDPAHGPLCPWCHGRGYSTAAILAPVYRQANHERNNGGCLVQEGDQRCEDAGEHVSGSDHRWQECPTYHDDEDGEG